MVNHFDLEMSGAAFRNVSLGKVSLRGCVVKVGIQLSSVFGSEIVLQ